MRTAIKLTKDNTNYIENSLCSSLFLNDIRKYEVLTVEEEQSLFKRYKEGDLSAKDEIIKANQRFAIATAKRFCARENFLDLVQEANMGMLIAFNKFDCERTNEDGTPVRFLSFASWYIRREICQFIVNNGNIVKKSNMNRLGHKITKISNEFFLTNGRQPSVEEILEIMDNTYDIKVKDKSDLYAIESTSISTSYSDDKDDTFEGSVVFNEKTKVFNEFDDEVETDSLKYKMGIALETLNSNPKEKVILEKLFGIGYEREYSMEELAEEYDLSKERIRQLKGHAITRLKCRYGTPQAINAIGEV